MTIMDECIPKCTLPRHKNLPWLSKNLKRAMQKWNSLFRRARSSGSTELWRKYKRMRNKVTSVLKNSKQSFFARNVNSGNKKQFWKTMKYLRKEQSTIPTLQLGDRCADNDLDKANMLNNHSLIVSTHHCLLCLAPMSLQNTCICWREAKNISYAQRMMFWIFFKILTFLKLAARIKSLVVC